MKILHINYSDQVGGAAISVMRLHKSLIKKKIKSKMLVQEKTTNTIGVISQKSTFSLIIDLIKKALLRNIKKLSKSNYNSTFSMNLLNGISMDKIKNINPDVVNLHWISNEIISLKEISKIKIPIVWTLVDMWLFCGGEHYSNEKRYIEGYFKHNYKDSGIDINKFVWNLKKKYLNNKIKIICISNWLAKEAKKSKLLKNFDIRVIGCALDTNIWKPIKKSYAKKILGINEKKKIILFGATGGTSDPRKGFKYLLKAINEPSLKNENFDILVFGEQEKFQINVKNRKIIFKTGKFYGDDTALRVIYSAADLIVAPSLLEAFGQVASEAGSCETPCVAFENTGFEDVIIHKKTGYLSKYKNNKDLANGILWCLKKSKNNELGLNARKNIINKFSEKIISQKYINLYKELI